MRHLFEAWPQVAERLSAARGIALFLDFDGTLAAFQPRPDDAHLTAGMRRALARGAMHPRMRVWIVSGRRRPDLQRRIAIEHVECLGLHGWENGACPPLQPEVRALIDSARSALASRMANTPGIWIEDKGPVFSVHFRGAPEISIVEARAA